MQDAPPLNLTNAAKEIGISPITLKRWFLTGKVADVARDRNGWRQFFQEDIARIRRFAHPEENPMPIGATGFNLEPTSVSLHQPRTYRAISLFSGIGGFELGFERSGFETVFQCELNPFCRAILEKHWPEVPKSINIKELKNETIPTGDVWFGGFPCQDLSLARMGKRQGLGGSRSGLFHEFARLAGKALPRVFVLENVPGLLSSHGGKDFSVLLNALAELGYAVGWRTLNSQYFGAPQSRQRVYIVGCYRDREGPGRILFEPERSEGDITSHRSDEAKSLSPFKTVIGDPRKSGPVVQSIAYCLYACSARHTGTDWSRTYVSYPKKGEVRRLTPRECEGVMAFPYDWTIPAETSQFNRADMDSLRYHALGNAVTPPTAEWLGQRVYQYLNYRHSVEEKSTNSPRQLTEKKLIKSA